jgi:DNA replication and repair protein RecF
MLKENAEVYRLEGMVTASGRAYQLAVAYQNGGRKKITIDKSSIKAAEMYEHFTVVSAAPDDAEILAGAPSHRRDFLNIYLSQASLKYLYNLIDYQKALEQKRSFLKQNGNDGETPYDELLVRYGSQMMLERLGFIESLKEKTTRHYEKISGGQNFKMVYNPSVPIETSSASTEQIETAFCARLEKFRERERILQMSLVGPHRDELDFSINDYPARTHSSQGELRTAAISLKLAVFEYLKEHRRETPLLLLDEIFAELDSGRRDRLIESFGEFGQLFLTTAAEIPDSLACAARKFRMEKGIVIPE